MKVFNPNWTFKFTVDGIYSLSINDFYLYVTSRYWKIISGFIRCTRNGANLLMTINVMVSCLWQNHILWECLLFRFLIWMSYISNLKDVYCYFYFRFTIIMKTGTKKWPLRNCKADAYSCKERLQNCKVKPIFCKAGLNYCKVMMFLCKALLFLVVP